MTISADHHTLANDIQRLIRQEQYTEAQNLLPSFAQAVIEACNRGEQEQEFLQAKQFLRVHHLKVGLFLRRVYKGRRKNYNIYYSLP